MKIEEYEEYVEYVEKVTPKANLWMRMGKAFVVGGSICLIGQVLQTIFLHMGIDEEQAKSFVSMSLIFISVLLTGFNWYGKIADFGGAGALVPITGFANSVAAPAIEFQKEGWVFGVGCKIFTIAGPVILYGLFASWCVGILQLFCQLLS